MNFHNYLYNISLLELIKTNKTRIQPGIRMEFEYFDFWINGYDYSISFDQDCQECPIYFSYIICWSLGSDIFRYDINGKEMKLILCPVKEW